ncbi:hypothetical protein [Streptomyces rimosus]|uniref:hypothetical protein n=1 Tax=Streptomyces rimosus TaxID=1927 RepID=UPI0037D60EC7
MSKRSLRQVCALLVTVSALVFGAASPAVAQPTGGGDDLCLGRVVAHSGLMVRKAPAADASLLDHVAHGEVVTIVCKVNSQSAAGDGRWYLLVGLDEEDEDAFQLGWVPAQGIAIMGPTPVWC